jgi:16S rRNA (uracil1498-N3)-methyltransferase
MAGGELEPAGEVVEDQRPMPELTVAFALVKGERPELVVRALTEIGVDRIVPFTAERSVVRWDETKAHAKLLRLAEIARQAAMQSRRSFIPRVGMALPGEASPHRVPPFAEVATLDGAALASRDGGPASPTQQCVLVGPEGGWGAEEQQAGLPRLRLAAHVLRTETAAIAAGELLVALRAGLVAAAQGTDTNARPPRGGGRFNCPPPRQSIE